MITCQLTLTLATKDHQLPATLPNPDNSPLQTPCSPLHDLLLSTWRVFRPILLLYQIPRLYFKAEVRLFRGRLSTIASVFRSRRRCLLCVRELWIIILIACLFLGRIYCYRKLSVFMTVENEFWVSHYTKTFNRRVTNRITRLLSQY